MPTKQQPEKPQHEMLHATFYALAPDDKEAPAQPEASTRSFDVVASTDALDRGNRVVVQDWDLATYVKNPVVYWNHAMGAGYFGDSPDTDLTIPIGFATNVRVEENQLRATLNFVDAAANPLAEKVYQGMRQGSIRAVSVGWYPHEIEFDDELGVLVCRKNELLEISPCAIPANPEAGRTESARLVASLQHLKGTLMPSKLAAKLRLKASASDEDISSAVDDIVSACDKLKGLVTTTEDESGEGEGEGASASAKRVTMAAKLLQDLVATTGAKNAKEAIVAVALLKAKADEAGAELEAERLSSVEKEIATLIKQAEDDGKFTPANKPGLLAACGADKDGKGIDVERLKLVVASLQPAFNKDKTKTPPATAGASATATLDAKELAYCERNGIEPTDYAKSKARVASTQEGT